MNSQPLSPIVRSNVHLEVAEVFYSIQGEGPYTGEPAVFVRLAGCNLCCVNCDTEYTSKMRKLTFRAVYSRVRALTPKVVASPLVVITGGEPLRQDFSELVHLLHKNGFRIQIETNGTLYQPLPWDKVKVVCSPKTPQISAQLEPHIAAYKYVLSHDAADPEDGLPTTSLLNATGTLPVARPSKKSRALVFVTPLATASEEANAANLQAAIWTCLQHGYRLGLQLHKIIGVA